jgi:hypothetical protein
MEIIRVLSIGFQAVAHPPFISNDSTPPKPYCWRAAKSC